MTIFEMINLNRELMRTFRKVGIRLEDERYIDLYNEYLDLLEQGDKICYIVAILAIKYEISERKVYYLIRKFKSECNLRAV